MDWSDTSARPAEPPAAIEHRLTSAFPDRCGQDSGWFVRTITCDKGVSVFVVGRSGNVVGKRTLQSSETHPGFRSGHNQGRAQQSGLAKFEPFRNLANGLLLLFASIGVLFLAIGEMQKLLSLTDASIGTESRLWLGRTRKELPEKLSQHTEQMQALYRHWSGKFQAQAEALLKAVRRARANYLRWTIRSKNLNAALSGASCEAIANSSR